VAAEVETVCSSQKEETSPLRNSITLRLGSRMWPCSALALACSASISWSSSSLRRGVAPIESAGGMNEVSISKLPETTRRKRSRGKLS
jgi:hypothetical protein